MMFDVMGSMMTSLGSLMTGMFGGLFDFLIMPMWTMMSGWFGFAV